MSRPALCKAYPVNSLLELTLKGNEKVRGVVYCTDEVSQTVVLKKSLNHTTLASEVFVIQANAVTNKEVIEEDAGEKESIPLGTITKKALEQQERRAIKLAEEALQHINQKACEENLLTSVLRPLHIISNINCIFDRRLLQARLSLIVSWKRATRWNGQENQF